MPDHVFISYSRDDEEFVLKLRADLEELGVPIWLDTGGIRAGETWRGSIVEAIENCAAFLIVLTPKSVASDNVVKELAIADGSKRTIVPLVHQDHELTPDMKYTLAGLQRLEFTRGRYEDNLAHLVEVLPRGAEETERVSESIPESQPSAEVVAPEILTITTPIQIELIHVQSGEFLMGSDPARDKDAKEREQPQHRLGVRGFYIGKYPVTNAQYSVFVQATGHNVPEHWKNRNMPEGKNNHPVVSVTWNDAIAFSKWLRGETNGKKFHLPSEAEWEYAARGGPLSKGYIFAGSSDPHSVAWFDKNSGGATHPVGGKRPNELDVYDMSGNVWEWTRSLWGKAWGEPEFKYPYNPQDGREALRQDPTIQQVLRGGAFDAESRYVRCANRHRESQGFGSLKIGFRVVVSSSTSDL